MITTYELQPQSKPSQVKTIRVPAGARKQVAFKLVDGDGQPRNLHVERVEPGTTAPDYSPQPALSAVTSLVRLRASDRVGGSPLFDIEGKIEDPLTGYLSFILETQHTQCFGLYYADVGLFAEEYLTDTFPVRILIEPNTFHQSSQSGMLSVPEVRLALMDTEHDEESLLDSLEFRDEDIYNAARRVIDLWNETPPSVLPHSYSSFPWRGWWLKGTLGYLYEAAAARYRRDRLAYSAGGVSIDDKNKAAEYQALADQHRGEFMEWMRRTKVQYNIERCWGSLL